MQTFDFTQVLQHSQPLIIASIVFEVAIAFLLWFRSTRILGIFLGVLFHLLILLFLGPYGQNWNQVVWPWNIAMILLLVLLYTPRNDLQQSNPFAVLKAYRPAWISALLLGVFPLFNIFGLWPVNLSFKMYAGNNPEGILYAKEANIPCLSSETIAQVQCLNTSQSTIATCYLIIDDWAFSSLGVAPFSSPQRLKQVARIYCSCLKDQDEAGLEILEVKGWKEEKPEQKWTCKELINY